MMRIFRRPNFDADAVAYLIAISVPNDATVYYASTAYEITGAKIWAAVHQFVVDRKTFGLWAKDYAIYPMIGGTSAAHAINLKDPRNLDAAYRSVFNGGWTHSGSGALPNGSTGYADTKLNPSLVYPNANSANLSYYSGTNSAAGNKEEIGADVSGGSEAALIVRFTGDIFYPIWKAAAGTFPNVASTDSRGLFSTNRITSGTVEGWKNGVQQTLSGSGAQTGGLVNRNLTLGAQNAASVGRFSDRECRGANISLGFSSTESANNYVAWQRLQTSLFRQV